MEERITVIVPVYNIAAELPRCLDSILAQSYTDIEIIAVDDGSTDGSSTILDQYRERYPKIRVIHKENAGVTVARLRGVEAASGEWIGFVDGDDYIEPDMYERLLTNAEKYDADISHCGYQMNFADGRIHYFHNTGQRLERSTEEGLRDILDGTIVEPGLWNKLYKRELLDKMLCNSDMPADIKINEDLLMNFILFSYARKSIFEDFCPYHYIVRAGSASRQRLNTHLVNDPICAKEHILKIAPEAVVTDAQRAYMRTCIGVYGSILLLDQPEFAADSARIRGKLLAHYAWTKLLGKKQQLLSAMIRYAPWAYKPIYRFYVDHILRNPYK